MGCRTCLIACVEAHTDQPIFEIPADSINFNPKLHMIKSWDVTVPFQCRHCENPDCLKACDKNAIYIEDGVVCIDYAKCDGCKECLSACPFGCIDMALAPKMYQNADGTKLVANKCDLCRNREGGPACISVCPTQALRLVETSQVEGSVSEKRARIAYRNAMLSKWLTKKEDQNT